MVKQRAEGPTYIDEIFWEAEYGLERWKIEIIYFDNAWVEELELGLTSSITINYYALSDNIK